LQLRKVRAPRRYADGLDRQVIFRSLLKAEREEVEARLGIPPEDYSIPRCDWEAMWERRERAIDACDPLVLAGIYVRALRVRRPPDEPIRLIDSLGRELSAVAFSGAFRRLPKMMWASVTEALDGRVVGA
jgi:hypothetical protein